MLRMTNLFYLYMRRTIQLSALIISIATNVFAAKPGKPSITKAAYGEINGQLIYQYTLTNGNGMQVKVINYGATITDILAPDRDNKLGDVVLGFRLVKAVYGA
jgi:hypothetical protein